MNTIKFSELSDPNRWAKENDGRKRQGNTGVWTFVLKTPEGKILARSEWGTNYEFSEAQWLELPILPP